MSREAFLGSVLGFIAFVLITYSCAARDEGYRRSYERQCLAKARAMEYEVKYAADVGPYGQCYRRCAGRWVEAERGCE